MTTRSNAIMQVFAPPSLAFCETKVALAGGLRAPLIPV
jgi:hypothetical protein